MKLQPDYRLPISGDNAYQQSAPKAPLIKELMWHWQDDRSFRQSCLITFGVAVLVIGAFLLGVML